MNLQSSCLSPHVKLKEVWLHRCEVLWVLLYGCGGNGSDAGGDGSGGGVGDSGPDAGGADGRRRVAVLVVRKGLAGGKRVYPLELDRKKASLFATLSGAVSRAGTRAQLPVGVLSSRFNVGPCPGLGCTK